MAVQVIFQMLLKGERRPGSKGIFPTSPGVVESPGSTIAFASLRPRPDSSYSRSVLHRSSFRLGKRKRDESAESTSSSDNDSSSPKDRQLQSPPVSSQQGRAKKRRKKSKSPPEEPSDSSSDFSVSSERPRSDHVSDTDDSEPEDKTHPQSSPHSDAPRRRHSSPQAEFRPRPTRPLPLREAREQAERRFSRVAQVEREARETAQREAEEQRTSRSRALQLTEPAPGRPHDWTRTTIRSRSPKSPKSPKSSENSPGKEQAMIDSLYPVSKISRDSPQIGHPTSPALRCKTTVELCSKEPGQETASDDGFVYHPGGDPGNGSCCTTCAMAGVADSCQFLRVELFNSSPVRRRNNKVSASPDSGHCVGDV
ncbi:hypothetical protein HDK64DRAFT_314850 [Phyllosticta capitalensis]